MSAHVLDPSDRARRRAAVGRTPGLCGVDRAEGRLRPDGALLVRLFFVPHESGGTAVPSGLTPARIRLSGPHGPVPVLSVTAPVAGRDWVGLVAAPAPTAPAQPGAVHTVQLAGVPSVDPVLSWARFSVGGGASVGRSPQSAPVEPSPRPAANIDYLAKDYSTFRTLMLDRMATTLPTWKERHPADIGVMLVEVLAYAADYLSYQQDAAATEAYLGTARLRTSLSRHARLLDYAVSEGCSAVAWVQVRVASGGFLVPRGTRVLTRTSQSAACLLPGSPTYGSAVRERPLVFETLDELVPDPGLNEIPVYTWGASTFVLQRGATSATLRDARTSTGRALDRLRPGQALALQEVRGARGGAPDPTHRQAVRLSWVERRTDPVGGPEGTPVPIVEVGWHEADALTFDLVVAGTGGGASYSDGAVALGNLVLADHGMSLPGATGWMNLPTVEEGRLYRPLVPARYVSRAPVIDRQALAALPAAVATTRSGASALPEVRLEDGGGRRWTARHDLLGSSPFSRDFVVEADDEGVAHFRFGDGALGMAPPPGTRFRMRCRVGLGPQGNVGRDILGHLVAPEGWDEDTAARILQVRNPLPATGGSGPESAHTVRTEAPQAFHIQQRGATDDDWVMLAGALSGVRAASARAGWAGAAPADEVYLQRDGGFPEDDAFLAAARAELEPFRPAGRDLRVLPPSYVGIDVSLTIQLTPHALRAAAEQKLRDALGDGPNGVFAPAKWSFAESAFLSVVISAAAAVSGVAYVVPTRFARWSPYGTPNTVADELPMGAHEVARMSGDASEPWNGSLSLELRGGMG